jgi:hypothetical protein
VGLAPRDGICRSTLGAPDSDEALVGPCAALILSVATIACIEARRARYRRVDVGPFVVLAPEEPT